MMIFSIMLMLFGRLLRFHFLYRADVIYSFFNGFLVIMILTVLKYNFYSNSKFKLNYTWLIALLSFIILVFLTYGTALLNERPGTFAIIYIISGLIILGFLGKVYVDIPLGSYDSGEGNPIFQLILSLTGFIAKSYGELFSVSWLWFPPKSDDVWMCATILHELSTNKPVVLHDNPIRKNLLQLLLRLKLVKVEEGELKLTYEGRDLVEFDDSSE